MSGGNSRSADSPGDALEDAETAARPGRQAGVQRRRHDRFHPRAGRSLQAEPLGEAVEL